MTLESTTTITEEPATNYQSKRRAERARDAADDIGRSAGGGVGDMIGLMMGVSEEDGVGEAADTEADNLERKYGTNDDEMFNKILRTHSDAASQVDMSTFSRNGEIYQFTTSHNSSMTNMSQIDLLAPLTSVHGECAKLKEVDPDLTSPTSSLTLLVPIMDYNSYNITTVNLRSCKQKILTPYLRLLKLTLNDDDNDDDDDDDDDDGDDACLHPRSLVVQQKETGRVGWRPFADDRYYRYWWVEFINLVYPILVLLLLLFIYAWQVGNCWWNLNARIYIKSHEHKHMHTSSSNKSALTMSEDTNLTTINKKGNVECQQNMPTYLITDILHLIMFCMGMVFFRYHGDEQVCGLLEKVFLEIESLRNRNVSNNIMVRKFRIFMGAGITWVLMTVGLQILYFWIYRSHIFITTESLSSATIWSLVVLEVIGVFMINTVSLAAVCNYVIQCEAIILFVRGISLRFLDSGQDLPKGMKQLVEIKCHLKMLNSSTGKMTSLVTFIFAAFTVIGLNTLCMNTADQADIWVYRSLFPLVWGVMLFAPLIQFNDDDDDDDDGDGDGGGGGGGGGVDDADDDNDDDDDNDNDNDDDDEDDNDEDEDEEEEEEEGEEDDDGDEEKDDDEYVDEADVEEENDDDDDDDDEDNVNDDDDNDDNDDNDDTLIHEFILVFAFLAARVNSACKRFHNDALSFAANGYKALPQAELDSYVLFTSNAKLRAKLFQIPIMAHYLVGVLVFACFLFPILFQTGVLKIKPAKKSWYS
uniref:Uncharacterized protein n=1 Tax=Octopus bimaculoides TaxID=37653 RepID=A0A0L8GW10_OCTBM